MRPAAPGTTLLPFLWAPAGTGEASQMGFPAVRWAQDGYSHLIERKLETEAQGGPIHVAVEPACSPGSEL